MGLRNKLALVALAGSITAIAWSWHRGAGVGPLPEIERRYLWYQNRDDEPFYQGTADAIYASTEYQTTMAAYWEREARLSRGCGALTLTGIALLFAAGWLEEPRREDDPARSFQFRTRGSRYDQYQGPTPHGP